MMWMLMMIDLQVRACKDDQEAVGEEKDPEEGHDQEGVGVIKVDAHGGDEGVSGHEEDPHHPQGEDELAVEIKEREGEIGHERVEDAAGDEESGDSVKMMIPGVAVATICLLAAIVVSAFFYNVQRHKSFYGRAARSGGQDF